MKRRFLILLSTIFAIAAIGLVLIQITQTRRSAKMSDNLFNISVNNAIDEVFNQLEQMKVCHKRSVISCCDTAASTT